MQAILQSPAYIPASGTGDADATYTEVLRRAKASNLEELWKKDTKLLMQINAEMSFESKYGTTRFGPTVDGYIVPQLPSKLLKDGRFHTGLPMLFGHTKSDGLLFTPPWARSDDDVRAHLRTLFPNITKSALDQVIDKYPAPSSSSARANVDRFATLLDDATIRCNSHYLAEASLASNTRIYHPVFKYEFNVPPATHGENIKASSLWSI